jgi:protein involved in sex pheromone biosynthesis
MDCEGAEEEIMKNLKISPRVITIEIHSKRSDYERTLSELSKRGYEIKSYWSNEGSELTEDEFNQIIKKRSMDQPTEGAPLVTAIKN